VCINQSVPETVACERLHVLLHSPCSTSLSHEQDDRNDHNPQHIVPMYDALVAMLYTNVDVSVVLRLHCDANQQASMQLCLLVSLMQRPRQPGYRGTLDW
jgi:hypothetical protein